LAEHDIGEADDLFEILNECKGILENYGVNTERLEEKIEELKNLFE
jgi:hypothetical protein